jgi:BirA family transcriptional regulator, biotin operon repressor / biotin---[acetyl-CoA-carboxylase] ligase
MALEYPASDTDYYQLDSTVSTNDFANNIVPDAGRWAAVHANEQSSGRGQRGSSWHAEPGKNILCSFVFCPPVGFYASEQFRISAAAALGTCRYLQHIGAAPRIKWPNDIYCGVKKIAGILIENSLCGQYMSKVIIGIGLNLNQEVFPAWLPNPTSALLETGASLHVKSNFHKLYSFVRSAIEDELSRPYSWTKPYHDLLYGKGEVRQYLIDGLETSGTIESVSKLGLLEVRVAHSGASRSFGFKEIGYVLD